jgi:hypothetical protein
MDVFCPRSQWQDVQDNRSQRSYNWGNMAALAGGCRYVDDLPLILLPVHDAAGLPPARGLFDLHPICKSAN